jgi:lysozyme family protein
MKDVFPKALKMVLHHEGDWADHPADPGGATMKGVTLKTFSDYLGREASKDELKAISDGQLQAIYKKGYWDKISADSLPVGVDIVVFDMAVNGGPGRAAKLLQKAVGVNPDGGIGPMTLAAVASQPAADTIVAFSNARREFYRSLPTFETFGKGWLRRVDEVEAEALKMSKA